MSRCPKLRMEYIVPIAMKADWAVCELTGIKMELDDTKVKHICDCDYCDAYENCPIYKDR